MKPARRNTTAGHLVTKNSKHDEFILLHLRKGWTIRRIAAHLGIAPSSVSRRYHVTIDGHEKWGRASQQKEEPVRTPSLPKLRFLGEK